MASVSVEITATGDDGYEGVGLGIDTSSVAAGYARPFEVNGFLRFLSVTGINSGATINTATITLNVTTINGTPNTTFYGVDVDDAAAFANPGNLPSAAARTSASASGPTATGSQVINVKDIVQEIVNRAGWASGNDMAFICDDNAGSGDNFWAAEDYEDAGTAEAVLAIDYTNPGGSPKGNPLRSKALYSLTSGRVVA